MVLPTSPPPCVLACPAGGKWLPSEGATAVEAKWLDRLTVAPSLSASGAAPPIDCVSSPAPRSVLEAYASPAPYKLSRRQPLSAPPGAGLPLLRPSPCRPLIGHETASTKARCIREACWRRSRWDLLLDSAGPAGHWAQWATDLP